MLCAMGLSTMGLSTMGLCAMGLWSMGLCAIWACGLWACVLYGPVCYMGLCAIWACVLWAWVLLYAMGKQCFWCHPTADQKWQHHIWQSSLGRGEWKTLGRGIEWETLGWGFRCTCCSLSNTAAPSARSIRHRGKNSDQWTTWQGHYNKGRTKDFRTMLLGSFVAERAHASAVSHVFEVLLHSMFAFALELSHLQIRELSRTFRSPFTPNVRYTGSSD